MHCLKNGSCAQCTHPEPRSRAHYAQVAPCRCAHAAPCRDVKIVSRPRTKLVQPQLCRDTKFGVATWRLKIHVVRARRVISHVCCRCRESTCAPGHARPGLACHDMTYCVATRTGKWAVAHPSFSPAHIFFSFLFRLFYPLQNQQKSFSFFFFSKSSSSLGFFFFFQNLPVDSTKPATSKMQ